jgi:hypothetical protein
MTTCTRCEIDKEDNDFYPCSRKANGLHSWCKKCQNTYGRERWAVINKTISHPGGAVNKNKVAHTHVNKRLAKYGETMVEVFKNLHDDYEDVVQIARFREQL